MNALSGGRSKRYFRISEHHPRWTSNRTFCVAPEPVWLHLGHVYRHFRSKTLAPSLLSIVKGRYSCFFWHCFRHRFVTVPLAEGVVVAIRSIRNQGPCRSVPPF